MVLRSRYMFCRISGEARSSKDPSQKFSGTYITEKDLEDILMDHEDLYAVYFDKPLLPPQQYKQKRTVVFSEFNGNLIAFFDRKGNLDIVETDKQILDIYSTKHSLYIIYDDGNKKYVGKVHHSRIEALEEASFIAPGHHFSEKYVAYLDPRDHSLINIHNLMSGKTSEINISKERTAGAITIQPSGKYLAVLFLDEIGNVSTNIYRMDDGEKMFEIKQGRTLRPLLEDYTLYFQEYYENSLLLTDWSFSTGNDSKEAIILDHFVPHRSIPFKDTFSFFPIRNDKSLALVDERYVLLDLEIPRVVETSEPYSMYFEASGKDLIFFGLRLIQREVIPSISAFSLKDEEESKKEMLYSTAEIKAETSYNLEDFSRYKTSFITKVPYSSNSWRFRIFFDDYSAYGSTVENPITKKTYTAIIVRGRR